MKPEIDMCNPCAGPYEEGYHRDRVTTRTGLAQGQGYHRDRVSTGTGLPHRQGYHRDRAIKGTGLPQTTMNPYMKPEIDMCNPCTGPYEEGYQSDRVTTRTGLP